MGKMFGDYSEARTLFAFMFYFTFCFLCIKQLKVPPELNNAVSFMIGYWFGTKSVPKTSADIDNAGKDGQKITASVPDGTDVSVSTTKSGTT